MGFRRIPLVPTTHYGATLVTDPDTDLANRLEKALPYTLDTSKSFARSLIENQRQWGWSDRQREWAHKLVLQARDEYRRRHPRKGEPAPATPRVANAALARVVAMFDAAKGSLKKPMIRLSIAGRMANVKPGREGGLAMFWSDTQGGNGFAGRVSESGEVSMRDADALAPMIAALDAFADPEAAAQAYAQATKSQARPHGNCCFCGLHLTDKRSVTKGYGPICASHYNLPWGE